MADIYIVDGERVNRETYRKLRGEKVIYLRTDQQTKGALQQAAERAGQSLNAYILQSAEERMQHETTE